MHRNLIPVWFFVGMLLAIYGLLIFISGLVEFGQPTAIVLANLHAPIWWGAVLAVVGGAYCIVFRPRR